MIGENIKNLRIQKNLTQNDLAKILSVSRQAVCMWEAEKREVRVTMLKKIAKALDVPIDELINKKASSLAKKAKEKIFHMNNGKKPAEKKIGFELMAPDAKAVFLTGDFNAWDSKSNPMQRNKKGLWKTTLTLKPGKYQYKFVVDDEWRIDPANINTLRNDLGTLNSVSEVNE
jgi:transcriptional regulator with XRE-family HTH domain